MQTRELKWESLIPVGTEPPTHLNQERTARFRPLIKPLRYDPSHYSTYLEQLGIQYPTLRQPSGGMPQ